MFRWIKRLVLLVIILAVFEGWFFVQKFPKKDNAVFGLNFSLTKAQYLGFDWMKMYLDILNELKPKKLRVMGLWEVVEPARDEFHFREIDIITSVAKDRDVKLTLTLGLKQPGWPECHQPEWALGLDPETKKRELLDFVKAVVERYKDNPAIEAWQVENEPFFIFGPDCPAIDPDFLSEEIALVRSLDSRPIILTDSGEKGTWLWAGKYGADIFGSTMYREAYHDKYERYITYPIPPIFYRLKAGMLKTFYPKFKSVIGAELQGEPWFTSSVFDTPWNEQLKHMDPEKLKSNAEYAAGTGFDEHYFWGVEWWYWAKEKQKDARLWNAAKEILSPQPPLQIKIQP